MEELIKKFWKGKISEEEKKRVYTWTQSEDHLFISDRKKEFEAHIGDSEITNIEKEKFEKILKEIHLKISVSESGNLNRFKKYLSVAAVLALLISFSYAVYEYFPSNDTGKEPSILQLTESIIENNYSEKIMHIHLKDGSDVKLYPESRMKLLPTYGKTERGIQLEGKAHFKVAKNPELPFVVSSGSYTTTALGTEFSVQSNPERIRIKLYEGKIAIETKDSVKYNFKKLILKPNEEFSFEFKSIQPEKKAMENPTTKKTIIKAPEPKVVDDLDKKDPQILRYRKESLDKVIEDLNDNYGEKIVYEPKDVQHITFTGEIYLSEPLINSVNMICNLNQLNVVSQEDKTLKIYRE